MPKSKKKGARLTILDKAANAHFKAVYEAKRDIAREKRDQKEWVKICLAAVTRDPRDLDVMGKMTYDSMVRGEDAKAEAGHKKRVTMRPRA